MAVNPVLTSTEPLPFLQAMMKAVTSPKTATFRNLAQNPKASAGQGFLWVAITAAIASLVSGVLFTIFPNWDLPIREFLRSMGQYGDISPMEEFFAGQRTGIFSFAITLVCGVPLGVLGALLGLAIGAGLMHVSASLLGGRGDYGKMVYMLALVQAPVTLVNSLLVPIPYLGCLSFLIGLYFFVLVILAIEGVYQFGVGKAALAYFIPVIVVCLAVVCIAVGIIALFSISLREVIPSLLVP